MTQLIYMKFVRCDMCGAEAEKPQQPTVNPPVLPDVPEDWLSLDANVLRRANGEYVVQDLCPVCKLKPFADIFALTQ